MLEIFSQCRNGWRRQKLQFLLFVVLSLVEEVKNNFEQASAPDHMNMIPEDLEELICDQDGKSKFYIRIFNLDSFSGSRMSLSAFRQESCPEFEIRKHDITRNIRKIHSMGS